MNRTVGTLIVCASLFALQTQSLAFHTHEVDKHTPGAHDHGPAIHHHAEVDAETHIGETEPVAGRVLTVAVPSAIASVAAVIVADISDAPAAPAPHAIGEARAAVDPRSHGPPAARDSSLRGPPFSTVI